MSATTDEHPVTETTATPTDNDVVEVHRRTIDKVLIGFGLVAAAVFATAGGLLTWGANFSDDYVHDELETQKVFFPPEAELREEGRDDLVKYADEQVTTGPEAEAYASFIDGHLQGIANGQTYAQIDDRGAAQAVEDAKAADAPQSEIDDLQATADQLKAQRDSLFRGETLRGLLLSAFAWSTIGRIAGIAATVAFAAALVMTVLVVLGFEHVRRTRHTAPTTA